MNQKMKVIRGSLPLILACATMLTTSAKATLYNWEQDEMTFYSSGHIVSSDFVSAGTLNYDPIGNTVTSFSFSISSGSLNLSDTFSDLALIQLTGADANRIFLNYIPDNWIGALILHRGTVDYPADGYYYLNYVPNISPSDILNFTGNWVTSSAAVPEPTTACAGVLLLLPFGAGLLRNFRKSRKA